MNQKYSFLTSSNSIRSKHLNHWQTELHYILIDTKSVSLRKSSFPIFILALSGIIYHYVTTNSCLTFLIYYTLKTHRALMSKVRINTDNHFMCEVSATVNVQRAECCLSDDDTLLTKSENLFFTNIYFKVYITNPEQISKSVRISNEKRKKNIFKYNLS